MVIERTHPFILAIYACQRLLSLVFKVFQRQVVTSATCLAVLCGIATQASADRLSRVATAGQSANGLPPGVTISRIVEFNHFEPPVIGQGGHVAFWAMLTGTGIVSSSDSALFRVDPLTADGGSPAIRLVAREGDVVPVAPGDPAAYFYTFDTPMISDGGRVAFYAQLSGTPAATARGYWGFDQSLQPVARQGSNGFGTLSEGRVLDTSNSLMAFRSSISDGMPGVSYWLGTSTGSSLVARSGQLAAGTAGAMFASVLRSYFNASGQAVLYSTLSGGDTTSSNSKGLWYFNGTSLTPVARAGSQALGRPAGVIWTDMSATSMVPSINSAGTILFPAFLSSSSGTSLGQAIYRRSAAGQTTLIAASGDQASVAGDGVSFANLAPLAVMPYATLTDDGTVVFGSTLSGPGINTGNDRSVWSDGPAGRKLILRGGQTIQSAQGPVQVWNASVGGVTRVNALGEIATLVTLGGTGIDSSNDLAIVSNAGGQTRIIAQEGQVIPESGGYRLTQLTVGDLFLMNALGQVVFRGWLHSDQSAAAPETAILRVDEAGQLRILAIDNKENTFADGQTVLMRGIYASPTRSLNDNGQFTFSTNAGDGHNIFVVKIEPRVSCPADFNSDGSATVQDIFDFLSLWFAQDTGADFNNDSAVTVQDLFDFLDVWFGGC